MPDAVNPDRNSLVYVYAGDDGPADGDIVQFSATTGRWEAVQGGTSVPDSSFHAVGPASGGADLTAGAVDIVWDPDQTQVTGTDITLNVDGKTIQIGTTGIYNLYIVTASRAAAASGAEQYGTAAAGIDGSQQEGGDLWNMQTEVDLPYVGLRNVNTNVIVPIGFGPLRMMAGDTIIIYGVGNIVAGAGALTIESACEVLLRRVA